MTIRTDAGIVPAIGGNRFSCPDGFWTIFEGQVLRIYMKDLQAKLEKLLVDAEDCELIPRLATDKAKQETFSRIAKQLRNMAAELKADISAQSGNAKAP
jgi:hypothetical protein